MVSRNELENILVENGLTQPFFIEAACSLSERGEQIGMAVILNRYIDMSIENCGLDTTDI